MDYMQEQELASPVARTASNSSASDQEAKSPLGPNGAIQFDDIKALRLEDFFSDSDDDSDEGKGEGKEDGHNYNDDDDDDFFANKPSPSRPAPAPADDRLSSESGRAERNSNGDQAAASGQANGRGSSSWLLANTCALSSDTDGGCLLTYGMIEWAVGRAKRSLAWSPGGQDDLDEDQDQDLDPGGDSPEPSESSINSAGELFEQTVRLLALRLGLGADQVAHDLQQVDVRLTSLWRSCPRLYRQPMARSCLGGSPYYYYYHSAGGNRRQYQFAQRFRSHTGQCNNPLEPRLGASYMPFVRLAPPDYADGVGLPRGSSWSSWSTGSPSPGGPELPPVRLVALWLHQLPELPGQPGPASESLSMLFANWGQLINHDLAMASNARASTGHTGHCCGHHLMSGLGKAPPQSRRLATLAAAAASDWRNPNWRVCMPIELGPGDPVYSPFGLACHEFKRSLAGLRPGCSLGPRTQLNTISSFVDASFVYGSTSSASLALRRRRATARLGQLDTWNYFGRNRGAGAGGGQAAPLKPLLPPDESGGGGGECLANTASSPGWRCFLSGDSRTNQQVPLATLHTIHTRQHNRLARGLAQVNPHWPGARLYEEARRIHIGLVQHILLAEYLPLLLGAKTCQLYNLTEPPDPAEHWDHYDPTVNPGIAQEFAAAAFRQGHGSVASLVYRLDPWTRQPRRVHSLRETFRQPWALFEPGALDEFLVGLTEAPAQANDPYLNQELSGHLLQEPGEPVGLDLASINLQRGRDQGVAGYMAMRQWCGLATFADFQQLAGAGVMPNATSQLMEQLYSRVDDIDLFAGGLSEFSLEGAQVGPTFACIIGHQFRQLRFGDRLWFEASLGGHGFTPQQLASIRQVPLARLLCANSDRIAMIQPEAMRLAHPILNPLQACDQLPDLDLSLWMEPPVANMANLDNMDDDDDDDIAEDG